MYHNSFHKTYLTFVTKYICVDYTFTTSVILNEFEGRISYSKVALMVNDWLKLVVNGTDSDLAILDGYFSFSFHYLIILGLLALLTN